MKKRKIWYGFNHLDSHNHFTYEDNRAGYSKKNSDCITAINAAAKFETEDIFRLKIITSTETERSARYELE